MGVDLYTSSTYTRVNTDKYKTLLKMIGSKTMNNKVMYLGSTNN